MFSGFPYKLSRKITVCSSVEMANNDHYQKLVTIGLRSANFLGMWIIMVSMSLLVYWVPEAHF